MFFLQPFWHIVLCGGDRASSRLVFCVPPARVVLMTVSKATSATPALTVGLSSGSSGPAAVAPSKGSTDAQQTPELPWAPVPTGAYIILGEEKGEHVIMHTLTRERQTLPKGSWHLHVHDGWAVLVPEDDDEMPNYVFAEDLLDKQLCFHNDDGDLILAFLDGGRWKKKTSSR